MNKNSLANIDYSDSQGKVRWLGHVIGDADLFKGYLRQTVASRVRDDASGFEEALRALATTDMASEQLERLRCATPDTKSWEIGEALAECFLETEPYLDVCWPWNTMRDRRTPRASLPGADLVGFCRQEDDFWLLIGEVKTSSDASSPPGVMSGKDGMISQLAEGATRLDIHYALLKWLHARCAGDSDLRGMFEAAVYRYLASSGEALFLVGVLIRDTSPKETDLRNRGIALAGQLPGQACAELHAWYLPITIRDLPSLMEGAR